MTGNKESPEDYIGVVESVHPHGKHCPYAVARVDALGERVTFALQPPVWSEEDWPEGGSFVILSDLRAKEIRPRSAKGWRANKARYMRPGDPAIGGIGG